MRRHELPSAQLINTARLLPRFAPSKSRKQQGRHWSGHGVITGSTSHHRKRKGSHNKKRKHQYSYQDVRLFQIICEFLLTSLDIKNIIYKCPFSVITTSYTTSLIKHPYIQISSSDRPPTFENKSKPVHRHITFRSCLALQEFLQ